MSKHQTFKTLVETNAEKSKGLLRSSLNRPGVEREMQKNLLSFPPEILYMLSSELLWEQEVLKHSEEKINFKVLNLTFLDLQKCYWLLNDRLSLFT